MSALNIRRTSDKNRSLNHMAIRYRDYPTKEQEALFSKTVGCKRKVWNLMLEDRNTAWQTERKTNNVTIFIYFMRCFTAKAVKILRITGSITK